MNFRQKAANSVQSPAEDYGTLEQQAEQAAHMAGKSVEAWLQDVINEQTSALNATLHHGGAAEHEADYEAKSAVLHELVDRVRYLEDSFEAKNQQQFTEAHTGPLSSALDNAAWNLNNNYDEDARKLIEGIRARSQGQNQLPPNPPQAAQAQPVAPQAQPVAPQAQPAAPQAMPYAQNAPASPQDASADRMMEMLGTLGYLEQQLKANLQQANAQPVVMMQAAPQPQVFAQPNVATFGAAAAPAPQAAPSPTDLPVNNEDTMRLSRLEEQLSRLEKHLTASPEVDVEEEFDDDEPVYKPKRNRRTKRSVKSNRTGDTPILASSSRKKGKKQGNQALRETMDAIVEQHTNPEIEGNNSATENDVASLNPVEAQVVKHNMDRRQTDRHFQTLMTKIEALNTGPTDLAMIESLKSELSALKGEVTAATAQTSFAGQNIQEEVKRLRTIIAAMPDQNLNPLIGNRLETLETDVSRIAEFLLKSPDLSAVPEDTTKLQSELNRLSDGLLAVIDRTESTASRSGDLIVSQLQENLSGLREDIVSNMQQLNIPSNVAGAVSSSFEERLNKLQTEIDGSLSALNGEVTGLGSGLKDQVSIISAQVHSATERLEALGKARNGDVEAVEKFAQMEGRLVKAAERLEAASLDAASGQGATPASLLQIPADLVTEQSLRSELGDFATSLGSTLESGQSSMVKRIDEALAKLNTFADTQGQMIEDAARRSAEKTIEHMGSMTLPTSGEANNTSAMQVDEALAKLDTFADTQGQMIEDAARRSAEKTIEHMGSITLSSSGEAINASAMQADLDEIRQMAGSLLTHNNNSFSSVHGLLDGVAGRLEKLEQQSGNAAQDDTAPSAALASELQNLRDYLSSMKTSADDLSAETRSSFHSVKDMLSRVSERLEALEASEPQAAPAPLLASSNDKAPATSDDGGEADLPNDSLSRAEEPSLNEETPTSPASSTSSSPTEEEVMARMRAHVKAREPDAPVLVPADDDMPIEPGSGRPDFGDDAELSIDDKPAFENKHEPIVSDEIVADYDDEHEDHNDFDMDVEDQTAKDNTGSKSDYIQAARLAAQAAAAEQALQLDDGPSNKKSSLSSIRERINMVARGGRKKVLADGVDADDADASAFELDKDTAIEPSLDEPDDGMKSEMPNDYNADLTGQFSDEKTKKSPLRKILMASVAVAIIAISGYLLKGPINALIGGSPTNTASQESKPNVANKPVAANKAVKQEIPKSAVEVKPNTPDVTQAPETIIDLNASSLPSSVTETETEAADGAQIVDPSTTQSIARQLDFNEASPQSAVIRDAMKLLPKDKVSDKLSEALLEGDPAALLEVGRRYGEGDIFERDRKKSAFWYEQAAAKGSAIAKFRLGTLYEDGVGVPKDPGKAKSWYIESADLGNARAMHNLAVLHAEGSLGKPDFKEAFKWFEKGANHGVKDSQFNVGILYVRGLGAEVSLVDAYKWFDVVAKIGDRDAAEKRDEIAKALTKEQLKDAKAKSAAYKAIPINVNANVISPSPDFWAKGSNLALGQVPNGLAKTPAKKQGSPQVKEAQLLLNRLGFNTGGVDGVAGKRTKDAIKAFEYEIGMPQTGRVSKHLIQLLKSQKI